MPWKGEHLGSFALKSICETLSLTIWFSMSPAWASSYEDDETMTCVLLNIPPLQSLDIVGCYGYFVNDVYEWCEPAQTLNLVNYVCDGVIVESL